MAITRAGHLALLLSAHQAFIDAREGPAWQYQLEAKSRPLKEAQRSPSHHGHFVRITKPSTLQTYRLRADHCLAVASQEIIAYQNQQEWSDSHVPMYVIICSAWINVVTSVPHCGLILCHPTPPSVAAESFPTSAWTPRRAPFFWSPIVITGRKVDGSFGRNSFHKDVACRFLSWFGHYSLSLTHCANFRQKDETSLSESLPPSQACGTLTQLGPRE